jgi:hypothetical protein
MIQSAILKKNKGQFKVMNDERREESLDWSPWLDFDRDTLLILQNQKEFTRYMRV